MNVAMRKPMSMIMSLAEFLTWENRQELRYEFDGFQPIAMTGETALHSAIQCNILVALTQRLRGTPNRPFGSILKIEVAGRIRYPDAFVTCTAFPPDAHVVTEPVVVFEVLSDSTAATDIFAKNIEYRATPTIQRYVILAQSESAAIVFHRQGDDWLSDVLEGSAVLRMPEIGIDIPIAEFYADIDLSPPPESQMEPI